MPWCPLLLLSELLILAYADLFMGFTVQELSPNLMVLVTDGIINLVTFRYLKHHGVQEVKNVKIHRILEFKYLVWELTSVDITNVICPLTFISVKSCGIT